MPSAAAAAAVADGAADDDDDAAVDADAGVYFSSILDIDRGGCESANRCPTQLKELCCGLGVELRSLAGLAAITSRVGSTDFEVARSFSVVSRLMLKMLALMLVVPLLLRLPNLFYLEGCVKNFCF